MLASCRSQPVVDRSATASAQASAPAPTTTTAAAAAESAATRASATPADGDGACPGDMALVEGDYCPLPSQRCIDQPKVIGGPGHHQCKRYAPASCVTRKRTRMRFCMDRYEWPNKKGELPRTLTSWPEALDMCKAIGKRLCTMDEFNFACEGEKMKAHVYGDERDPDICHFDRPYIERTYAYTPWAECLKNEACKKEFDRLDQRLPSGSKPRCVSDHGVFDLNGNVNEWVVRTDQRSPNRSGLKGGWWGPVRNRCRPMTTFHLEGDYGYEQGWRCCKDAGKP
jgi:hypothetical protein